MQLELTMLDWKAINDGVMGGLSNSRPSITEGALRFEGALSLENNGGFASIRAVLPTPVHQLETVRLSVSGDGRRYQVRLREDSDSQGVAWRAFFRPGREQETIELRPGDFQPVIRGEPVIGARPLQQCHLQHIGFMLADRQPGPFTLDVHTLELTTVSTDNG